MAANRGWSATMMQTIRVGTQEERTLCPAPCATGMTRWNGRELSGTSARSFHLSSRTGDRRGRRSAGRADCIAFGARPGGAVVILGGLPLVLAFFSDSVRALLGLFPKAVIGLVLFLTGVRLAFGVRPLSADRPGFFLILKTAAFCLWNVAIGFCVGIVVHHMVRRGLLKF